jgi:hypothetical protein
MDFMKDLAGKFLASLPLKKLRANQAFDLACDFIMLCLVGLAFITDLGPSQYILKPLLIVGALGIVIWSFIVNKS